jgi:hypothetical protein
VAEAAAEVEGAAEADLGGDFLRLHGEIVQVFGASVYGQQEEAAVR